MNILSTFSPTSKHEIALEKYIESGGSISDACEASGLGVAQVRRAMRSTWWQDRLRAEKFEPVTSEQIGDMLRQEVGHHALRLLTESGATLGPRDLLQMTRIADSLRGVDGGQRGRLEILARIDLRGLTGDGLRQIRGDFRADGVSDVIDAEYEVLDAE